MAEEESPNAQVANLHLDDVTGEMVSKSQLKQRQKMRELAEKKAEKAAKSSNNASQAQKSTATKKKEAEIPPEQAIELREAKIASLKESNDTHPYPHIFSNKTIISDFLGSYAHLQRGEHLEDTPIELGARVMNRRTAGDKLIFYEVKGDRQGRDFRIQIMCQEEHAKGPVPFEKQHENIGMGDLIGVIGYPGRTAPAKGGPGELSVIATQVKLLAPCLEIIPSKHYGFKDQEARYRNPDLDMIMNANKGNALRARAKINSFLRHFFEDRDFLEMETPMMNPIAGGATAKPFMTYHNDLKMNLYMRVAPELYLKRLVVGGFERVYELGRQFRNESNDLTHNPEFTSCEFYMAWADFNVVMDLTEDLVSELVKHVTGGYITKWHSQTGEEFTINWEKPWRRVEMIVELEKACGEKFPPEAELATEESGQFLKRLLDKFNIKCPVPATNGRMLDKLVGHFIEETCINPTFIINHPQMMSPLAKYHRSKPGLTERFEAFVCKHEILNAYTELNDPVEQQLRFVEQAKQKAQGDDEAQLVDWAFIKSLRYGLPPTGGWGMGIDRMVMFLTDNYNIKEVIAFPFMKDEANSATSQSGDKVVAEDFTTTLLTVFRNHKRQRTAVNSQKVSQISAGRTKATPNGEKQNKRRRVNGVANEEPSAKDLAAANLLVFLATESSTISESENASKGAKTTAFERGGTVKFPNGNVESSMAGAADEGSGDVLHGSKANHTSHVSTKERRPLKKHGSLETTSRAEY